MSENYYLHLSRWRQKLATDKLISPKSSLTVRLGVFLGDMTRPDKPYCHPSRKWLADQLGCSERAVTSAAATLIELGYVTMPIKGNVSAVTGESWPNRYEINLDIAKNFQLGAGNARSHGGNAASHGGGNTRSPESLEGKSEAADATASAGAPASAAAAQHLISIATEFGKRGDYATLDNVATKVETALALPGVTPDSLASKYRAHLEYFRGNPKYSGDLILRWLDNQGNYAPGIPGTKAERKAKAKAKKIGESKHAGIQTTKQFNTYINDSIRAGKLTGLQAKEMMKAMCIARVRDLDTPERLTEAISMIEEMIGEKDSAPAVKVPELPTEAVWCLSKMGLDAGEMTKAASRLFKSPCSDLLALMAEKIEDFRCDGKPDDIEGVVGLIRNGIGCGQRMTWYGPEWRKNDSSWARLEDWLKNRKAQVMRDREELAAN